MHTQIHLMAPGCLPSGNFHAAGTGRGTQMQPSKALIWEHRWAREAQKMICVGQGIEKKQLLRQKEWFQVPNEPAESLSSDHTWVGFSKMSIREFFSGGFDVFILTLVRNKEKATPAFDSQLPGRRDPGQHPVEHSPSSRRLPTRPGPVVQAGRSPLVVFPAPGEASGAQEGLRAHQQRGQGQAEGHAGRCPRRVNNVFDSVTSADLCPHPATTAGVYWVEEGERSAAKADSLGRWAPRPLPLQPSLSQALSLGPALPNSQQNIPTP